MRKIAGQAAYSHQNDPHAGHLYYIELAGRSAPPFKTQRRVEAILDIADDGTLAGIELIDNMPPPPVTNQNA
jgi:hypothetical protein